MKCRHCGDEIVSAFEAWGHDPRNGWTEDTTTFVHVRVTSFEYVCRPAVWVNDGPRLSDRHLQMAEPEDVLSAAGGFCAPYPVRDSLPTFKAERGTIRFLPPVWPWDSSDDPFRGYVPFPAVTHAKETVLRVGPWLNAKTARIDEFVARVRDAAKVLTGEAHVRVYTDGDGDPWSDDEDDL